MHKIKFGLHIGQYYDIFDITHLRGSWGPPTPRNWNSKSDPRVCQPNTNSFFDITEFPVKISARLTNFKGCFGMIWHFMTPSPTALPEPALWAGYEFLKEQTIKIHFRGDSCRKQYGFQPWIYLNWEYISISLYSHLWLYFRLPGPHMTHKTPLVYQM